MVMHSLNLQNEGETENEVMIERRNIHCNMTLLMPHIILYQHMIFTWNPTP